MNCTIYGVRNGRANVLFFITGELDKRGHPLIRGEPKPDFLVHIPGEMTNILVVEVKPVNAPVSRMADDLEKLTYFRRELGLRGGQGGNYEAAFFWLYGKAQHDWPTFRRQILDKVPNNWGMDLDFIRCFIHEEPGERPIEVLWE